MAIYLVQGKLGTGKSKWCVGRIRDALLAGRRVASNLDLYLDKLVPSLPRASYVRVPDKPTALDLMAIGHGNPETYDEDRNGLLVLDELGSWLNSRSFGDPARQPVIDWLIHARKHGWDVLFICQSAVQIDKQVREALTEYTVTCVRFDKMKVPFFGAIFDWRLPRFHLATVRMGTPPNDVVLDRDMFRLDDVHSAYDTRQVFVASADAAAHSLLSPLRFKPVFRPKHSPWVWAVNLLLRPVETVRALRSGARTGRPAALPRRPIALQPKLPHVVRLWHLEPDQRVRAWRALHPNADRSLRRAA